MPILESQDGHTFYQPSTWQGGFPTHVFPPIIRDAIQEVSATLNLPVELAAQAALGVVSLVCQDFINVQCPNFDPAPCSLFLMGVSNSSGGKSLADLRFRRAVSAFERKQEEDAQAQLPFYRAKQKIWLDDDRRLAKDYCNAERGSNEAQRICEERLLHEQNRPMEPRVRQRRYAEVSPQGLRDELVAHSGIGILSPDAAPVLSGMTFSQPAMLSGYWSGEDRPVGLAGGSRRPVEPRLTISVMLQVSQFSEYMKTRGDDAFGTGLLARFLAVAPEYDQLPAQQTCVEDVPEPKLGLFNERVAQLLNQAVPVPRERIVLRLSGGAKHYFKYFKDALNDEVKNGGHADDIKPFFRKLAQQASRIAALLHYFEGKPGEISPDAMKSAIALCEWYAHEYVRIFTPYAPSEQQKDSDAVQKLLEWLQGAFANPWRYPKLSPGRYTERDLNNYSPIRRNPQMLSAVIDALHRQGQISVMHGKKGGRTIHYPATNFAGQPQSFFYSQQAAASGDTGFITSSNVSPVWAVQHDQNKPTQAACSIFNQVPYQAPCAYPDNRNVAAGTNSVNNLSQQTVEAGNDFRPVDRENGIRSKSDELQAIKRELAERAMKAFNR